MTVCFTASEVHTLGGVPQFLARYAERLRAAGVDVHLLAGSDPDGGPPAIEGLRPVAGLGKGFTARGAWAMARAISKLPRDTLLVGNSLNAAFVTAVTARLTGRRPLRLTIVGEGALFARHRDLVAELGLADRFDLIARRAPGDIPWAEHDAFLLCSLSEGMPLSLLEAMAHGLPAIVTNAPGLGD